MPCLLEPALVRTSAGAIDYRTFRVGPFVIRSEPRLPMGSMFHVHRPSSMEAHRVALF